MTSTEKTSKATKQLIDLITEFHHSCELSHYLEVNTDLLNNFIKNSIDHIYGKDYVKRVIYLSTEQNVFLAQLKERLVALDIEKEELLGN